MLISYIIPVYNMEQYIRSSMRSIMFQECDDDIELIIVNDGSTDNSISIIKLTSNEISKYIKNITIIDLPINKGAGNALYEGFKAAKGDYICYLSADDILFPYKTQYQLKCMIESNADLSYCKLTCVGKDTTNITTIKSSFIFNYSIFNSIILSNNYLTYFFLNFKNPINSSTLMIKRTAFEKYGNWDKLLKSDCDGELLLRYSLYGAKIVEYKGVYPFPDLYYRLHPLQLSNDHKVMNEYMISNRNKYKKIVLEGNYPLWLKLLVRFIKV